jgi:cytochrome c-type biogenesis protein CcmF
MIPEIGNLALNFALAVALIQFVLPLVGLATHRWRLVVLAKPMAITCFGFVALAFGCLAWSFYSNDFSVANVAQNSNRFLPTPYRLGATWGSHEGSLLLWVFTLTAWTFAVAMLSKSLPAMTRARVLSILGGIAVGFLIFILFTSNPFDRILPIYPVDGSDLNPLLQDPGMVFHPPLLYMGYVGFSVAFAFAITALLEGRIDALWARWVRPWTLAAWMFLTLGIGAGSWWAYYELGWGVWWFWDPVENASFMPWLIGTALLHSLAATEKRGVFKAWTTLLAISAFSFSLLGTFLVRSGVLTSVHAFANDPVRGTYILIFLGVVVGASLVLFAMRATTVSVTSWFGAVSKEAFFLWNNLLLAVATFMVLIGTLQPIIAELLNLGQVSVGPPYFNLIFNILMTPLIFLVALGPVVRWREYDLASLLSHSKLALAAALLIAVASTFFSGDMPLIDNAQVALGVFLAAWVILMQLNNWYQQASGPSGFNAKRVKTSYYGMIIAHIGLAVTVVGVVLSSHWSVEKVIRLAPGQVYEINGYTFSFNAINNYSASNYDAIQGQFKIAQDGEVVAELTPEKRRYHASGQWMTEAGIDSNFTRDLYVSMGEQLENSDDWAIRVYIKAFVFWLWLGCIMMATGGLIAMLDKRYRKVRV